MRVRFFSTIADDPPYAEPEPPTPKAPERPASFPLCMSTITMSSTQRMQWIVTSTAITARETSSGPLSGDAIATGGHQPDPTHRAAAFGTLDRVTGELLNPSSCPGCFVCGSENPSGLGLHVHRDGTDAVAIWVPSATYQGYPDRLHGGIIGLLVDEMLVYAGAPHDLWGMTAKVRYWLRKPIALEGVELTLRGRLIQQSGRGFRAVVSVHSGETLVAEGEGMCVLRADSSGAE